MYPKHTAPVTT